jgi:hypothetical protein
MAYTTPIILRSAFAVLVLGLSGCGSDLVLPEAPSSAAQTVALTKVNGDPQTGQVGETLKPLVVRVVDQQQHPVSGLTVSFQVSDPAAGALDPASAVTNSAGEAVAFWTLGTSPGSYSAVASLAGVEGEDKVAQFQAIAEPGAPAALTAETPALQPGRREQKVQTSPMVQVLDRFGNPVPGVAVVWQVISGEGTVTPLINPTDPGGQASADWTLGDRIGVHKLTAAVEGAGLPVTFEAQVLF